MPLSIYIDAKFSGLEDCIVYLANIVRNTGGQTSLQQFGVIVGNSPSSSYCKLKLNAMKAYGFVEVAREDITVTPLGEAVAAPKDPSEFEYGCITALGNFPVFSSLTNRYKGRGEPEAQYVENAIRTEGLVPPEKARAWSECFLSSARQANLFTARSVTLERSKPQDSTIDDERRPAFAKDNNETVPDLTSQEKDKGWLVYPVVVPDGRARIIVPANLSRPAWEKLKKLLDAIEPEKQAELK